MKICTKVVLFLAAILLALFREPAAACPVCFMASERVLDTYFYTTLMLSALPLALVLSFAGWLFWAFRQRRH